MTSDDCSVKVQSLPLLLSPSECDELIRAHNHDNDLQYKYYPGARICLRKNFNDEVLAAKLQEVILQEIPAEIVADNGNVWVRKYIASQFRFIRYDPGHLYEIHVDASNSIDTNKRTFFTVMVYLNDAFEGGNLIFYKHKVAKEQSFTIQPQTGLGVVFPQDDESLPHVGEKVDSGVKFILRGDVVYELLVRDAKQNDKEEEETKDEEQSDFDQSAEAEIIDSLFWATAANDDVDQNDEYDFD